MTGPDRSGNLFEDARDELAGMTREGLDHPSTKPVLTGAAAGALAGLVLPVLSIGVGLVAGAGIVLYKRLRP